MRDIVVNTSKVDKRKISEYIEECEQSSEPIDKVDINLYLKKYQSNEPKLQGPENFALPATLRDQDDDEGLFLPPDKGITPELIQAEEIDPKHFYPNFIRPQPVEEQDPEENEFNELEPIFMIPGVLPEPYWDYQMGCGYTFSSVKQLMSKAHKMILQQEE